MKFGASLPRDLPRNSDRCDWRPRHSEALRCLAVCPPSSGSRSAFGRFGFAEFAADPLATKNHRVLFKGLEFDEIYGQEWFLLKGKTFGLYCTIKHTFPWSFPHIFVWYLVRTFHDVTYIFVTPVQRLYDFRWHHSKKGKSKHGGENSANTLVSHDWGGPSPNRSLTYCRRKKSPTTTVLDV